MSIESLYAVSGNELKPFEGKLHPSTANFAYLDEYKIVFTLKHGEYQLIAHYHKDENGDGQPVDVYMCAMPARFYKLEVYASTNGIGHPLRQYTVNTGTVSAEFVARLSQMIADGMIGFEQ